MAAAGAGTVALSGTAGVFPVDKLKHGGVCFAGTMALGSLGVPPSLAAGIVFASATIGKELVWDGLLGLGNCDPRDAAANLAGSLAAYTVLTALHPPSEGERPAPLQASTPLPVALPSR